MAIKCFSNDLSKFDPVLPIQISEIVPQFQIVIYGELGSAKGMLFAQHEMNLELNLLVLHSILQSSFLPKRAA